MSQDADANTTTPTPPPARRPWLARLLERLSRLFRRRHEPPPKICEPLPEDRQPRTRPLKHTSADDGEPWIGVDLDGTLAKNGAWRGHKHIGDPVPLMMERVRHWLAHKYRVKIFTARASRPEGVQAVRAWIIKHGLPADMEITNQKDFSMLECWDDRAVQVVQDTGRPFLAPSLLSRPRVPILPREALNRTFYSLPSEIQYRTPPPPHHADDAPAAEDAPPPPPEPEMSEEMQAIQRAVAKRSKTVKQKP